MSKATRSTAGGAASSTVELPFEEALQKLESIVETMESDELPLETLLARYEEGMKLAEVCQARLKAAEVRIQQLEEDDAGGLLVKPFSPAPGNPTEAQ